MIFQNIFVLKKGAEKSSKQNNDLFYAKGEERCAGLVENLHCGNLDSKKNGNLER